MKISEDTQYILNACKKYLLKNDLIGLYRYIFSTEDIEIRDRIDAGELYKVFTSIGGVDPMEEFSKEGYIPEGAFLAAAEITYLKIPDSIKVIEPFAFESCKNLNIDKLPKNLELIGDYAFCDCPRLEFDNGVLVIPKSVKFIGPYAFCGDSRIHTVKFEGTPNSMGDYIFRGNVNIKNIYTTWPKEYGYINFGTPNAEVHYK